MADTEICKTDDRLRACFGDFEKSRKNQNLCDQTQIISERGLIKPLLFPEVSKRKGGGLLTGIQSFWRHGFQQIFQITKKQNFPFSKSKRSFQKHAFEHMIRLMQHRIC